MKWLSRILFRIRCGRALAFALSFLLLSLGSLSAQASASSQDPVPGVSYETSASDLARMIWISQRLEELNVSLKSELSASKKTSQELSKELELQRLEAEALRSELSELKAKLVLSSQDLTGLREALTKAESSLANSQASWKEYEAEVMRQFRALKIQRNLAAIAAAVGWLLFLFL